jgi:glycosyltransferase involved in cell wall biosynthesis
MNEELKEILDELRTYYRAKFQLGDVFYYDENDVKMFYKKYDVFKTPIATFEDGMVKIEEQIPLFIASMIIAYFGGEEEKGAPWFKVGDTIICIDGDETGLETGDIVTLDGYGYCFNGYGWTHSDGKFVIAHKFAHKFRLYDYELEE